MNRVLKALFLAHDQTGGWTPCWNAAATKQYLISMRNTLKEISGSCCGGIVFGCLSMQLVLFAHFVSRLSARQDMLTHKTPVPDYLLGRPVPICATLQQQYQLGEACAHLVQCVSGMA
eukprot:scaffold132704_cov15-Tisochrysis_lutea.AAC.1